MYIPSADMGEYDEWRAPSSSNKQQSEKLAYRESSQRQLTRGKSLSHLSKGIYQSYLAKESTERQLQKQSSQYGTFERQVSNNLAGRLGRSQSRGKVTSQLNNEYSVREPSRQVLFNIKLQCISLRPKKLNDFTFQ